MQFQMSHVHARNCFSKFTQAHKLTKSENSYDWWFKWNQNYFAKPNYKKDIIIKENKMNVDLSKASGPDCIPVMVLKNCET